MLEHDFKLTDLKSNDPLISNSFNYQPLNPFSYDISFIQHSPLPIPNQHTNADKNHLKYDTITDNSNITTKSNPLLSSNRFNNDSEEDDINWENLL